MSVTRVSGHGVRRSSAILVLVFAAGAILGSRIPASPEPFVISPAATDSARAMPLETPSPSPAAASPGCDPVDQLFVEMFVGLTDAALSNAGVDRQEFLGALADDREALKRYLDVLGVNLDDAQLDALMGANLPGALLLPAGSTGAC